MIHFFGYFKETNHIGISSVGFEKAAIFLRNRDFRVVELLGIKDNEEVNLLYEDEELKKYEVQKITNKKVSRKK